MAVCTVLHADRLRSNMYMGSNGQTRYENTFLLVGADGLVYATLSRGTWQLSQVAQTVVLRLHCRGRRCSCFRPPLQHGRIRDEPFAAGFNGPILARAWRNDQSLPVERRAWFAGPYPQTAPRAARQKL